MQQQTQHTAILLFVRTQLEEVRSKKWFSGAGYQNDLKLAAFLNRQVLSVAKASGLPTFIISGKDQLGDHFAERFTNAIQSIFEKGFQQVIALGNDCLNLQVSHLLQAEAKLQHAPLVIGPAADGGAYLIGLSKELFDPLVFQCLPWQQSDLMAGLRKMALQQSADILLLEEESDADSYHDLKKVLQTLKIPFLVRLLSAIIGARQVNLPTFFHSLILIDIQFSFHHRGPPCVSCQGASASLF